MYRAKLLIVLIFVFILGIFFPQIKPKIIDVLNHSFFIQAVAVALGVIGGFFSSYVIESIKLRKSIIGALEALRGEILSNKSSITLLIDGIEAIPSIKERGKYSDRQSLIQMAEAEKFLADHARETLNDKIYTEILQILIELENLGLYEGMRNLYLDLNRIKSSLLMLTTDNPIHISARNHKEARFSAEKSFRKEAEELKKLLKDWEEFDKDVLEEIEYLKKKTLYRLF